MKSFALAAGFAAISVLGTAGAASAAPAAQPNVDSTSYVNAAGVPCIDISKGNNLVARGCFNKNGDKVFAGDFEKDGLWVRTDWQTNYDRTGDCRDMNSKGNGKWCNFNMAEKGKVKFQVELRDGDAKKPVAQTGWTNYLPIG